MKTLPSTEPFDSAQDKPHKPEKCSCYFLMFCSCPIYRALLKTADPAFDGTRESADYNKIRPRRTGERIQSHFSG